MNKQLSKEPSLKRDKPSSEKQQGHKDTGKEENLEDVHQKQNTDINQTSKTSSTKKDDDYEFWYHGTTLSNANNIRKRGIQLTKCTRNNDFSYSEKPGFYMGFNEKAAEAWAKSRCGLMKSEKPEVLKFKLPQLFFENLENFKGRRFDIPLTTKTQPEWQDIVFFYRNSNQDDEMPDHTKYDWIMGPMSKNPTCKTRNALQTIDDIDQVCVRSQELAEEVYKYLCN